MSKPKWIVTGEDEKGPLGMSVYLSDDIESPFIGILRYDESPWVAFLSRAYLSSIRTTMNIPRDIPIMKAWELAKKRAVEVLATQIEINKQKAIQEADEMIHQINNCI